MTVPDTTMRKAAVPSSVDLLVPNLADFNLRQVASSLDPAATRGFLTIGKAFGDQAVFWSARPQVLILHPGLDQLWLADVLAELRHAVPSVITPPDRTGQLVPDLLADGDSLARLRSCLARRRRVRLFSWGATPTLYSLIALVRSWGHEVESDVPPESRYWTSQYLDSKISCSDLATQLTGVRVPSSWTVTSWLELRGVLDALWSARRKAVIKSIHGVGGEGCAVVSGRAEARERFWRTARHNPFFRTFPMVVQEYVAPDQAGSPAVDMLIGTHGIEQTVISVADPGGHQFLTLGQLPLLPDPLLEERMRGIGSQVGQVADSLGFRGWLGVDFIAAKDGQLYLIEINARRTGGMHAIGLLSEGRCSDAAVAFSQEALRIPLTGPLAYADVRPAFRQMWDVGARVYPTTVRGVTRAQPLMGIVALGASAPDARRLARQLVRRLRRIGSADPQAQRTVISRPCSAEEGIHQR